MDCLQSACRTVQRVGRRGGPALSRRALLRLGAAAAAIGAWPARAAAGDTIRMAFPVPVGTLDPAMMRTGGLEFNYACYVFSRLTATDGKMDIRPDLATSWESSADLKSWVFHLRTDVSFHDGKHFDASDVVFTYKRLLDPAVASVMQTKLNLVSKVEALDPATVRFTLSAPYADMPALVSRYEAMILSERTIGTVTTKPVGTGPFRFVEYRPGDQMVLERNPDYFVPGLPKVARLVLRVIPEFTTSVAALESGEVDVVFDLPPEQIDRLQHSTVARAEEVPSGFWQGFVMHCGMKPFDDPRVREAFLKIIDKPSFTDIATFGHGLPTATPIPPMSPFYRADLPLTADIPGARKLLAEAGYPQGLTVEMFVPGNSPQMERLATAFRDAAKLADVTVTLRVVPQDKFFAEMEGKVPFNVDQFLAWTTPDLTVYDMYYSGGAWNDTTWHYHNDEVDRLLDAGRSTADRAEQARAYGRFQEIVAKDGPGSAVYVQNFACGVSRKLQNFSVSPLQLAEITEASFAS